VGDACLQLMIFIDSGALFVIIWVRVFPTSGKKVTGFSCLPEALSGGKIRLEFSD
jgi:hypothetical protein